MSKNEEVKQRVQELLDRDASGVKVTPELVIQGLLDLAMNANSPGAKARALELLGKTEAGGRLFVDRISNEDGPSKAQVLQSLTETLGSEVVSVLAEKLGVALDPPSDDVSQTVGSDTVGEGSENG